MRTLKMASLTLGLLAMLPFALAQAQGRNPPSANHQASEQRTGECRSAPCVAQAVHAFLEDALSSLNTSNEDGQSPQAAIGPAPPFELPATGCPMAHCDVRMSDYVGKTIPTAENIGVVWRRNDLPGEKAGSGGGIGCGGNGTIVACSFRGRSDNVIAYDYDGNRLWTSGDLLDFTSRASVPMVSVDGDVIAADQFRVVRFGPTGEIRWITSTPGGTPISPVITESGTIILAKNRGTLSAYNNQTGEKIATLEIILEPGVPGSFETVNTPSVRGERIYVTLRYQIEGDTDPNNLNWLAAIDLDADNPDPDARLRLVWKYEFTGPSGGSPLLIGDTLFFDGDNDLPGQLPAPQMYAVRDLGDMPLELWRRAFDKYIVVSAAQDPRGGLWTFQTGKRFGTLRDFLCRLVPEPEKTGNLFRLSEETGELLQFIRINDILRGTSPEQHFVPTSAMILADGPEGQPVMLLNVTSFPQGELILTPLRTFIIAIDLNRSRLLWQVELPVPDGATFGAQFPIVERDGEPRLIFTSEYKGTWAIGRTYSCHHATPFLHSCDPATPILESSPAPYRGLPSLSDFCTGRGELF